MSKKTLENEQDMAHEKFKAKFKERIEKGEAFDFT
jgi:hypothetical protein